MQAAQAGCRHRREDAFRIPSAVAAPLIDMMRDDAEEADLVFGAGFSDGDGDGVYVDIEAEIECSDFHVVVVCLFHIDESERIPRRERGRSCGSAHPGNPR
jgi:hypothetical protein